MDTVGARLLYRMWERNGGVWRGQWWVVADERAIPRGRERSSLLKRPALCVRDPRTILKVKVCAGTAPRCR